MALYWINNNILDNAFNNINITILPIDFSEWRGHQGNTIRIKIMEKITELYYSVDVDPMHKEIIKSLHLMLHECEEHLTTVLTSQVTNKTVIHENYPFKFYDFENKKIIAIPYNKSIPINPSSLSLKSRLVQEIRSKNRENILNLIENSVNCLPNFLFYGKSALMILIEMKEMNDITIKLIDKYRENCIINNLFFHNQIINYGVELIAAVESKNEEIALKLIDTFGVKYPVDYVNVSGDSLLMLSIKYNLLNLCRKFIEQYDMYCLPSQVNHSGETALIMACQRSYEDVALKLINTFTINTCLINKKNHRGKSAMVFAEERKLHVFTERVNMINRISDELVSLAEKITTIFN